MTKYKQLEHLLNSKRIVLFDGYCNLCSWSVQFILNRDTLDQFRFASLQSDISKQLLKKYNLPEYFDQSVILIENNKIYLKSDAALRISRKLRHLWPLAYIFVFVPKFFRNRIYDFIGENRIKWFGKKDNCFVPQENYNYKFL